MIIKNVQMLRALAANSVLLSHLLVVEQKYGHGLTSLSSDMHAGSGGVDLFFVISGFIMASILRGMTWQTFLVDRITRIVPPYWFYTTIVLVVSLMFPALVNSSFEAQPSIVRSYFLIPATVGPILAVGWTLIYEMYFYLVFALLLVFMARTKSGLLVWLLLWSCLISACEFIFPSVTQANFPISAIAKSPLTFEFIMGAIVGIAIDNGYRKFYLAALVLGVGAILALFLFNDVVSLIDELTWERAVLVGAPCALIVYGLVALELHGQIAAPAWLVALGNASYSTYLTHVLVLSAIGRIFFAMPMHNSVSEMVFVVICIVTANIVGLISHRLIERPPQRWLRKFLARS